MKTILILAILSICQIHSLYTQVPDKKTLDSLDNLVNVSHTADTTKLLALTKLYYYSAQKNAPSAFNYFNQIVELLSSSDEQFTDKTIMFLLSTVGEFADTDQLNRLYSTLSDKLPDTQSKVKLSNILAYKYSVEGIHDKAIVLVQKSIEQAENLKDKKTLVEAYLYAAFIHRNSVSQRATTIENYARAFDYFKKSLQYADTTNSDGYYATIIREIGNLYLSGLILDSALYYQKLAVEIGERNPNPNLIYTYHDIAYTYSVTGQNNIAKNYLTKAIVLAVEQGDDWALSNVYQMTSRVYLSENNTDSAIYFADAAFEIANKLNMKPLFQACYTIYNDIYYTTGDYKKAYEALAKANAYKDSIFGEESNKQIALLNIKFETTKKDKELIQNQARIKRQQFLIFSFIIGFSILIIFVVWLFRLYKRLHAVNSQLNVQNHQITEQNEAITKQRDLISGQNTQIMASIVYAQRIQKALLPSEKLFDKLFQEHLVVYQPRSIVSGDFYWIRQINNSILIAVADCTGHGVPGAFVSMLGISMLNDIARRHEVSLPNQALDVLRDEIKNALKQTGKESEQKDGMDIALCVIDTQTLKMNYAGAYNSVIIVRESELTELNADKQPIGIYLKERPFSCQEYQLQKGDMLYLYSDGYVDQFNNEAVKFKKKQFKELLLEIAKENAADQKRALNQSITQWKGEAQQTDDITVVGIRI